MRLLYGCENKGVEESWPTAAERHWRISVWALRVGYVALAMAAVGLLLLALGETPWLLAAGVVAWLMCAATLVFGLLWTLNSLDDQRPGFWAMRVRLLGDSVHRKPGHAKAEN